MSKHVLVPLAEGFEEIEAVAVIDILRRAGVSVTTAAVGGNGLEVSGAHAIAVRADAAITDCEDQDFDMIVLPGGMPGAANLSASNALHRILQKHNGNQGLLGAICAAPAVVLQQKELLAGRKVACYPSFREQVNEASRTDARLQLATGLITAAGPGVALEFGIALVRELVGEDAAASIAGALLLQA